MGNILGNIDNDIGIITLVTGQKPDGKDFYAYALIKPSKYLKFKKAEQQGNYNLMDYGEILTHGDGLEPSEEVKQQMAEEFGANYNFEEEFLKHLKDNMPKT